MGVQIKEIWMDLLSHEGLYQVSNIGRLRRVPRVMVMEIKGVTINRPLGLKVLKPSFDDHGYLRINIKRVDNTTRYAKLHRLIAETFIPNPFKKPYINHKDNNRLNNAVWNLEWCTQKENIYHAISIGAMNMKGEHNVNAINSRKISLDFL